MSERLSISQLVFWAKNGRFEMVRKALHSAGRLDPSEPLTEISAALHLLDNLLLSYPDLLAFVRLRLASEVLLNPGRPGGSRARLLSERPDVRQYLPVSPEAAAGGRWIRVPILLTGNGDSDRQSLLMGMVPDGDGSFQTPKWVESALDEAARDALAAAFDAANRLYPADRKACFHAFPGSTVRWRGASMGLPAALGFLALMTGGDIHPDVAATGRVKGDGAVGNVAGLTEKQQCLVPLGTRVLLCPAGNSIPTCADLLTIPVATLRQAWSITRLFTPEQVNRLRQFAGMLEDSRLLADNIHSVPPAWIRWATGEGLLRPRIDALLESPPLFRRFAGRFDEVVYAGKTDIADAVGDLLNEAHLAKAESAAPLTTFRWCTTQISRCNHRGRPETAGSWIERAFRLLEPARRADIEAVATFFNHYFIARHNRYDFREALPADLKAVLGLLESQYALQQRFGTPVHLVLGRLYGSIAQNFAFCGPSLLPKFERYSRMARTALGQDTVPEYTDEWRRQYNYLTYALLDAGEFERAESALLVYLGVRSWQSLESRPEPLTRWEDALIARFLADVERNEAVAWYLGGTASQPNRLPEPLHPRQLWCWNMGRLALRMDRAEEARTWFEKGLSLCRDEIFGPTIRVMGLMPLSGLRSLDAMPTDFPAIADEIRTAAEALNPAYFREVLSEPFEAVLEKVWEEARGLFPFNFR